MSKVTMGILIVLVVVVAAIGIRGCQNVSKINTATEEALTEISEAPADADSGFVYDAATGEYVEIEGAVDEVDEVDAGE